MKIGLVVFVLLASVGLNVSAQVKIGGKTLNTKKVVSAASDMATAITLSDADIAAMSREYVEYLDAKTEIAGQETEKGIRLERLTKDIKVNGLDLNFKVYDVTEVNAFACGDGSIRVYAGLMDIMDDAEVMAVIGHEIGHVVNTDVKDAMKAAYKRSAARNVMGATDGIVQRLTESDLGALAEALAGAQYSQKQENAADDYAFEFCLTNDIDPYGMYNSLNKLVELSGAGGASASAIQKMFSTHPDSEKRAKRMKEKADKHTGK